MNQTYLLRFIAESNKIERISEYDVESEFRIYKILLGRKYLNVSYVKAFAQAIQPGVLLRDRIGLNVRIGDHVPMAGGPDVVTELTDILEGGNNWYDNHWRTHIRYEDLHPFTDCNGRSGRAIWLWQMQRRSVFTDDSLTFLHQFYYQTLGKVRQ